MNIENAHHSSESIELVSAGRSGYRVLVAADASETVQRAASVLTATVEEMTGVRIPVADDTQPPGKNEIQVGITNRVSPSAAAGLGLQEFIIRSGNAGLILAGGGDLGTLYAVYSFLEDCLGCRWLTSTVRHIPKTATVTVNPIDKTYAPDFTYREVFYRDSWHRDFAEPNKLNGQGAETNHDLLKELHTGWGTRCAAHSANRDSTETCCYMADHKAPFQIHHLSRGHSCQQHHTRCLIRAMDPNQVECLLCDLLRNIHE